MNSSFESIRDDLLAFADDPDDVLIQTDGQALFRRAGRDIQCQFEIDNEGRWFCVIDGDRLPYRQFLVQYLAQLDVLAQRILTRRKSIPAFVEGKARLDSGVQGRAE